MTAVNPDSSCAATPARRYRAETQPLRRAADSVGAPWLSERSALLGICLRWTRGNLAEAEDLLGDACLRILESDERDPAAVDRPLAFWATVIGNLGRDRSRRTRRWNFDYRGRGADVLGALPARTISAEQQMFLKECLTATDRGLARLSDRPRTAVLLRAAGIDYSEIGDVLNTSSANARKLVATARMALMSQALSPSGPEQRLRRAGRSRRVSSSYVVDES